MTEPPRGCYRIRVRATFVTAMVICASACGAAPRPNAPLAPGVAATVDGDPILDIEVAGLIASSGPCRKGRRACRRGALDELVERRLIEHEARVRGILVTESDLDGVIDDVREMGQTQPSPPDPARRTAVRRMLLRFRLASIYALGRITVSDEDVSARYAWLCNRASEPCPELEALRPALRQQMFAEAIERMEPEMIAELHAAADVVIRDAP